MFDVTVKDTIVDGSTIVSESTEVIRLILDSKLLEEPMVRPPLKVLMDLARDVPNTMLLDADLPNGELSSRSIQHVDAHQRPLSLRPPTILPDMDLSANKMDSPQLLSQKFFKMVIMISKFVLEFLRKYSQLS